MDDPVAKSATNEGPSPTKNTSVTRRKPSSVANGDNESSPLEAVTVKIEQHDSADEEPAAVASQPDAPEPGAAPIAAERRSTPSTPPEPTKSSSRQSLLRKRREATSLIVNVPTPEPSTDNSEPSTSASPAETVGSAKRRYVESSDDEEFTGFELEPDEPNSTRPSTRSASTDNPRPADRQAKRIKEEPLSDNDHAPEPLHPEVKMEQQHDYADDDDDADADFAEPAEEAAAPAAEPVAPPAPAPAAVQTRRSASKRTSQTPPKPPAAAAVAAQPSPPALPSSTQALVDKLLMYPTGNMNAAFMAAACAAASTLPGGPVTVTASGGKTTTNISDPRFKKPFRVGWKRELVYRAHNDVHRKQYDKAEVYYITPAGKKLRTRSDILMNLSEGLVANDFTFAREPIGMSPDEEIIRSAKVQAPSVKRPIINMFDDVDTATMGFGKRVPKPKVPKGASPPPSMMRQMHSGRNSLGNKQHQQQQQQILIESDMAAPKSKAKSTAVPTTGDDAATPPFKRRLITRSSASPIRQPSPSHGDRNNGHPKRSSRQLGSSGATVTHTPKSARQSSAHTLFATNFFDNVSTGYQVLMHTFQYLKVQELLRASRVCRMWQHAAHHSALWRTVRMKNSPVNDWPGLVNTIKRNGTQHLDLRKMLIPAGSNVEETWQHFSAAIGRHAELQAIDLCRSPARVVEQLFVSNEALRVLNSVSIRDEQLRLANVDRMRGLRELRLRSLASLNIDSLEPLAAVRELQHLSLTSVKMLGTKGVLSIGQLDQLESLELGECSELGPGFGVDVLMKLRKLQRLRLEKGVGKCCTFEMLDAIAFLPALTQLELVNFDIKPKFDEHLERCRNVKRLLVIPTYISQSATTNHTILSALLKVAGNLDQLTWVVTLELLRVTELYVDQCDGERRDRKQSEHKIPVLKPVPGISGDKDAAGARPVSDVPQVEILPLEKVEKILAAHMPATSFSIMKLPYHATWRQCLVADGGGQ